MITRRSSIFIVMLTVIYVPFLYSILFYSGPDLPPGWVIVSPIAGLIFWFWSLWDWGNRVLDKRRKFWWLVVLLLTLWFGSTLYLFVVVPSTKEA